jgi:histidinol phosphatase-like PHP family hydrolase
MLSQDIHLRPAAGADQAGHGSAAELASAAWRAGLRLMGLVSPLERTTGPAAFRRLRGEAESCGMQEMDVVIGMEVRVDPIDAPPPTALDRIPQFAGMVDYTMILTNDASEHGTSRGLPRTDDWAVEALNALERAIAQRPDVLGHPVAPMGAQHEDRELCKVLDWARLQSLIERAVGLGIGIEANPSLVYAYERFAEPFFEMVRNAGGRIAFGSGTSDPEAVGYRGESARRGAARIQLWQLGPREIWRPGGKA